MLELKEPIEPTKPLEPSLPKKTILVYKPFNIPYGIEFSIEELTSLNKEEISSLRFKRTICDDGCFTHSTINIYVVKSIENKNYFKELKIFKKKMKRYLKNKTIYDNELQSYKKDLIEYFEWMKQENKYFSNYHNNLRVKYLL